MRSLAAALVLAAALTAGCGHGRRVITPQVRRACESFAARVTEPGTSERRELVRQCLRNFLHPAGGGG